MDKERIDELNKLANWMHAQPKEGGNYSISRTDLSMYILNRVAVIAGVGMDENDKPTTRGKRILSAAAKARISAAQKARWKTWHKNNKKG